MKKPSRLVINAEAKAGGMRALARLLGVSPSTVHAWRTRGPSAKGLELLAKVKLKAPSRLPRGAAGPVRRKAQQLLDFVKKFEKRSEAAKKSWESRRLKERKRTLGFEWLGIHTAEGEYEPQFSKDSKDKSRVQILRVHIQNNTPEFKQFMAFAKTLSFTTKQAKDFWFSPKVV